MGGFGGYNEKKNKKKKQGQSSSNMSATPMGAPVFTPPKRIEKVRKEK